MNTTTTRPVNLTDEATLRAKADAWIASNGLPIVALVESAIRSSDLAGDPLLDNPFRRVLLEVTAERLAAGEADRVYLEGPTAVHVEVEVVGNDSVAVCGRKVTHAAHVDAPSDSEALCRRCSRLLAQAGAR